MDIKEVRLKKGMNKDVVNNLISEWTLLEDDVYNGFYHKHNWTCMVCGKTIHNTSWDHMKANIRDYNNLRCSSCKYEEVEKRYK